MLPLPAVPYEACDIWRPAITVSGQRQLGPVSP
jgi:hypothetical protein